VSKSETIKVMFASALIGFGASFSVPVLAAIGGFLLGWQVCVMKQATFQAVGKDLKQAFK
jgi:hypothetical protein